MAEEVKMSNEAAEPIKDHFVTLAQELDNATVHTAGQAGGIEMACGEFSDSVSGGSDKYRLSWSTTFAFCGEGAQLIAGNTNVFTIELERLDTELSMPDLSPGGPR